MYISDYNGADFADFRLLFASSMLLRLQIENYALIEQAVIEFGPGFNVLTGETGSGKSIIVDALALLFGERADTSGIRSGSAAATVTGTFLWPLGAHNRARWMAAHGLAAEPEYIDPGPDSDEEAEILVRRELTAAGRSRAFIDNQPVTLATLRELAVNLGEIHSQHESLTSFTPADQLALLDRCARHARELTTETDLYREWYEAKSRLSEMQQQERRQLQEADLWRFQLQEIDSAQLKTSEDEALTVEHRRLANASRILEQLDAAYASLYDAPDAANSRLKSAERQLGSLSRLEPEVDSLVQRLTSARGEIEDVALHLRRMAESLDASPQRLTEVEKRLNVIDLLRRKYGSTLAEVLSYRDSLAARLDFVDHAAAHLTEAAAQAEAAANRFRTVAGALSRVRRAAAGKLCRRLEAEAKALALDLRFEVRFDQSADAGEPPPEHWQPSGWDRVFFYGSTNRGEPLKPVTEVASGGELSRLLLALYVVAGPAETSGRARTMVLDEVDAGIGGSAAEAVGAKLRELGTQFQVLCVTHLPQIATFASHHLHVNKRQSDGRTHTEIATLAQPQRVEEIARMLAGNQLNSTSLKHARELLAAHASS